MLNLNITNLCLLLSHDKKVREGVLKYSFSQSEYEHFITITRQVLPNYLAELTSSMKSCNIDSKIVGRIKSRGEALRAYTSLNISVVKEITELFSHQDIKYCLLKGAAARLIAYGAAENRSGLDTDIAVNQKNLNLSRDLLYNSGFYQAKWLAHEGRFVQASIEERKHVRDNHYELGYIVRRQKFEGTPEQRQHILDQIDMFPNPWHLTDDGTLAAYVIIDVHHGLSLDIDTVQILDSSNEFENSYGSFYIPSIPWLLFHLIYKLYWEGVHNYNKGLYQYADIIGLLRLASKDDLAELLLLLDKWKMVAAGYYVLRRLPEHFDVILDSTITNFLESSTQASSRYMPIEENNLGDMWNKIWGFR